MSEDLPYRPCVGVMLMNREGRVFAGRRIDNPGPAWQMPQGGIDPGEKPSEAAYRELWEETGVTRDLVEKVAKTHGWVTYDLPPELLGKVGAANIAGRSRNGSCSAIWARTTRSPSRPNIPNSRNGAGSTWTRWLPPSCPSSARSMKRWCAASAPIWPDPAAHLFQSESD